VRGESRRDRDPDGYSFYSRPGVPPRRPRPTDDVIAVDRETLERIRQKASLAAVLASGDIEIDHEWDELRDMAAWIAKLSVAPRDRCSSNFLQRWHSHHSEREQPP
jgi:hypothetical protein